MKRSLFRSFILHALLVWAVSLGAEPKASSSGAAILSVKPQTAGTLDRRYAQLWEQAKRGQIGAVVFMLEMYPDSHFYFLDRDARMVGQTALLIAETEKDPNKRKELLERIHFLNMNRVTKNDPLAMEYLAQEGISRQTLQQGRKIVFFDTAFQGSIPTHIINQFPDEYRSQMKVQMGLGISADPRYSLRYPSSRLLHQPYDPRFASRITDNRDQFIRVYTELPKEDHRATHFEKRGGKIVPVIDEKPAEQDYDDGIIDAQRTRVLEADLSQDIRSDLTRLQIAKRRAMVRQARELYDRKEKKKLIEYLRNLVGDDPARRDSMVEAFARDFLETIATNKYVPEMFFGAADIGLRPLPQNANPVIGLIKAHPEWAETLQDPGKGIPRLLRTGTEQSRQELKRMIEAIAAHGLENGMMPEICTSPGTTATASRTERSVLSALSQLCPIHSIECTVKGAR